MANLTRLRTVVVILSLASAVAAAKLLTPKPLYTESSPPPAKLAQVVPASFAGWKQEDAPVATIVSPDVQAVLQTLYSDNLSRTYVNAQGDRVMLSLAYGADQSRALQVHKPEVCYEAQGFKIEKTVKDTTATSLGPIPLMRVMTRKGLRPEPVTYWIRTGDKIVRGWFEQNAARLQAGLSGYYPDGILVRISTIDPDTTHAYAVQDQFIKDLTSALPTAGRQILLGAQYTANKQFTTP